MARPVRLSRQAHGKLAESRKCAFSLIGRRIQETNRARLLRFKDMESIDAESTVRTPEEEATELSNEE